VAKEPLQFSQSLCRNPTADPTPPQPGTPYPNRATFERFECQADSFDAFFCNVLTVTTQRTTVKDDDDGQVWKNAYRMTYSLAPNGFLNGKFGGHPTEVLIDGGKVEAWFDGKHVVVKSTKEVQLADPVQTGSIQASLMDTELSQQLGELACCTGKKPQ